jgi:hypothetical protein
MPNPVSMLESDRTNQYLARIRAEASGDLNLIDPSERLKMEAKRNFYQSDSHWNPRGARVWLDQLNEVLKGAQL